MLNDGKKDQKLEKKGKVNFNFPLGNCSTEVIIMAVLLMQVGEKLL